MSTKLIQVKRGLFSLHYANGEKVPQDTAQHYYSACKFLFSLV